MQKRKGSSRFKSRNSHRERKQHRAGQPFPPPCEDTKSPSSTSITLPEVMSKTIPGPSASPEMVSHRESSPNLAAVPWARLGQVTTQGSSQDRERVGASRPRVLSSPCRGCTGAAGAVSQQDGVGASALDKFVFQGGALLGA